MNIQKEAVSGIQSSIFFEVKFECLLSTYQQRDPRQVSEILQASISSSIKMVITVLPFMIVVRLEI